MRFFKIILSIVIIFTAYFGDYVVFKCKYSNSFMFRAISDSFVHGTIGFLSSLLFFSHENNISSQVCAINVLICTFLSSFIDIDHFIVAKSIYMRDLTNLRYRGIFHNSLFCILLTAAFLLYSYFFKNVKIYILSFMLLLAFTSHHIRDANRRGLWLYPFDSTPPIEKNLYIFLLAVLPHFIAYFYLIYKSNFVKNVIDYALVV